MVNNSTNINKTKQPPLTSKHKTTTIRLQNQFLVWDRHKHLVGLNRLMRSQPPLDNWTSGPPTILFGKHHLNMYNVQILITSLVSSNTSYPIIIDVMSYKGQKDYKSCKVQSHTTTPLLIYYKHNNYYYYYDHISNTQSQ